MGIESISIISKLLTQTQRAYVRPLLGIRSYKPILRKTEELTGDVCNISKSLDIEEFFNGLISRGIGLFNNPKTKQAFIEKIQHNNITLDELKKIMTEVDSKAFINLTNPTKTEIVFKQVKGVKLVRPLDFKEAEFVLKNNYTPQEMSEFVSIRERLINSRRITIEDADVIIKNKMNKNAVEHFVSFRQQGFESDKALFASYLKESEIGTISNKEISKFLELNGKKITYRNSEGKALEYVLPPEEAAYCTKYDFNETQIQRFAKLRNEYFAKDSIRNSGTETKFEVEDILNWIKKDVSDQEIFNYNFIINNIQSFLYTGPTLCTKEEQLKFFQKIIKRIPEQDLLDLKNLLRECSNKTNTKQQFNLKPELKSKIPNHKFLAYDDYHKTEHKIRVRDLRFTRFSSFLNYKIKTPEQIFMYNELVKHEVDIGVEYIACHKELYDTIMRLAKDESLVFENFNGEIQKLGVKELATLSAFIDLTKIDIKLLLERGLSVWHKVCTGETEGVSRVFESARNFLQSKNRQITSNLVASDIHKISKPGINQTNFYRNCLRLDENNNLIFDMGSNSFKVTIEKTQIEGKPVILIKDLEHNSYYAGFNGAVSKIAELPQNDREQLIHSLFGFSKYSKKQDEIYADAIEHFPIRIIDKNSECIIGKGIPILKIEPTDIQMTDREFINHFQYVLQTLKNNNALTVDNILRIMPEFSTIQVNPYTTSKNGKMLYSISAEWKSADGVKWQLRTHSTDLEHYMNSRNNTENSDWIFRLGHEENGVAKFFEYNEAERKYTPTGDFLGRTSHIQIPHSPFSEEDNLLDNIHFQNIMRQISNNLAGGV